MKISEHRKLHMMGKNNPHYGKRMSDESRKKMSDAKKGKKQSIEWCKQRSIPNNKTGIMRLYKMKSKQYEQGFVWRYRYYDGKIRKSLSSKNLFKLMEKILDKGLEWIILDEKIANETIDYARKCLENY